MTNNRTPLNLNFLAMGVSAMALALSPAVSAQENSDSEDSFVLEEIIITSQKRVQSLQDVALSVSVVGAEMLKNAGIDDFDELAEYVPNFQKADSSIGSFLVVRGISSGLNNGFEQSVVIYSDEISLGRSPLSRAPFLDLARIEVVRGPQNVLNGKNSIGGALNLTTADPTQEMEGAVGFEYDVDNNGYDGTFMLSGGLSEKVMARFAGRYFEEDGYFTNNINGNNEASRKEVTLRGTVKIDFTDTMTARLKYEHNEWDYNGRSDEMIFGYEAPAGGLFTGLKYHEAIAVLSGMVGQNIGTDDGMQDFARNTNFPETSHNTSDIASLQINWDIGENTLTATSGWAQYQTDELLDVDGSGFDVLGMSLQREDYEQFSQDIRITSPGGEKFDWIIGAFYQQWDLGFNAISRFDDENLFSALGALGAALGGAIPALAPLAALSSLSDFDNVREFTGDSKTWAVYGQATYSVSDTLRLTLGARYSVETKTGQRSINIIDHATGTLDVVQGLTANAVFGIDYQNLGEFCAAIPIAPCFDANGNIKAIHNLDESRKEKSFTPTVIIEWDATDDSMVYASYSKGFKAGGFDARGNLAGNFQFAEEKVDNYEIGVKSRLLDGAATFNLTAFYMDYTNLQTSQFDGQVGFVVGNAAAATTWGLEAEARWLISEGLTMTASAGYLNFKFDEFMGSCDAFVKMTTGQQICDYSGKENIFTPSFTAATSFEYYKPVSDSLSLRIVLDANYRGAQYVEASLNDDIRQKEVVKLNARIALEGENFSLALLGKNLTNVHRATYITDTPLSGMAALNTPAYTAFMDRPRSISVQFGYRF